MQCVEFHDVLAPGYIISFIAWRQHGPQCVLIEILPFNFLPIQIIR